MHIFLLFPGPFLFGRNVVAAEVRRNLVIGRPMNQPLPGYEGWKAPSDRLRGNGREPPLGVPRRNSTTASLLRCSWCARRKSTTPASETTRVTPASWAARQSASWPPAECPMTTILAPVQVVLHARFAEEIDMRSEYRQTFPATPRLHFPRAGIRDSQSPGLSPSAPRISDRRDQDCISRASSRREC